MNFILFCVFLPVTSKHMFFLTAGRKVRKDW